MSSAPTANQKQSDADQKPSPEQVDLAVAELRYETAFHLEVIQAMMDGITLGAEQVQDKRLEFLEAGPTIEPEAIIMTIAMTLVLEGTVGPALAALMTAYTMRPIMRSISNAITGMDRRAGFQQLRLFRQASASRSASAALGPGLSSSQRVNLIREAQELRKAADRLAQNFRGQRGSTKPIMDSFNRVTRFTQDNLVAGFKSGYAVSNLPGSSRPLEAGSSPGVAVLAAAMADASRFRLTVAATQAALEAEIKRPTIKLSEINTIIDDFLIDGPVELGQIRDSFQLATEVMIWAALFLDEVDKEILRNRRNSPGLKSTRFDFMYSQDEHQPMKLRADSKITEYLLVRLKDEIERWARETNAWTGTFRGFQRPTWGPNQSDTEKEDLLVSYLAWVADNLPTEFSLH